MSDALYGGKILISETGSPVKNNQEDESSLHNCGIVKVDEEEKDAEIPVEYGMDGEDGDDRDETTEGTRIKLNFLYLLALSYRFIRSTLQFPYSTLVAPYIINS